MYDFQRRSKIKRRIYSRTSLVLLAAFTFVLAKGAYGVLEKERQSGERLARLETELTKAEEKYSNLSEELSYLETQAGVEREIRDRFSVSKEGEEVAIIVVNEEQKGKTDQSDEGVFGKVSRWLKGLFD